MVGVHLVRICNGGGSFGSNEPPLLLLQKIFLCYFKHLRFGDGDFLFNTDYLKASFSRCFSVRGQHYGLATEASGLTQIIEKCYFSIEASAIARQTKGLHVQYLFSFYLYFRWSLFLLSFFYYFNKSFFLLTASDEGFLISF